MEPRRDVPSRPQLPWWRPIAVVAPAVIVAVVIRASLDQASAPVWLEWTLAIVGAVVVTIVAGTIVDGALKRRAARDSD